jgi:stearoyl-CoA desaturase (delta-9 desaturase)
MLATTGIYHRLITHKSYRPRLGEWVGCVVAARPSDGAKLVESPPSGHHQHTDQVLDSIRPYSPQGIAIFVVHELVVLSRRTFPTKMPSDVENDGPTAD